MLWASQNCVGLKATHLITHRLQQIPCVYVHARKYLGSFSPSLYLLCQFWCDCSLTALSWCQRSLQPLFWPVTTPLIPLCFLYRPRRSSQLASPLLSCMSLCQEGGKRRESQGSLKNNNRGFPLSSSRAWKGQYLIWADDWQSCVFGAVCSLFLLEVETSDHFVIKDNELLDSCYGHDCCRF